MRRCADWLGAVVLAVFVPSCGGFAQQPAQSTTAGAVQPTGPPHRTRLILKDGSYQVVVGYRVLGKVVSFASAERGGTEDIPYDLIDWDATHKWERQHPATTEDATQAKAPEPEIDPELAKEEADRAALTPEVEKNLRLPEQDSVLGLDYFHGAPQLVPLVQTDGQLNHTTSHNILKLALNPRASSHQIVQLKGVTSAVQMHVNTPVIYLRLGDDSGIRPGGGTFTVDTHGAGSGVGGGVKRDGSGGSASSGYVIVRADVRTDARVLASFNIGTVGGVRQQADVVETTTEVLPGGHWMKLTPKNPLDFGEYALMEIVSEREVNTGVWDFGVHPVAPENRDVIKPQAPRPVTLERRGVR